MSDIKVINTQQKKIIDQFINLIEYQLKERFKLCEKIQECENKIKDDDLKCLILK